MKTKNKPIETSVNWQEIAEAGMPPAALRKKENGLDRTFLVRGEYSLYTAHVFADGSGFDADTDDTPVAWAAIVGF